MKGQYLDQQAFDAMMNDDPLLYEVYELQRPTVEGELSTAFRLYIRARSATNST